MTTKEYLSQVSRINKMINNKLSEVYQIKTLACSISVAVGEERVQSSGSQDRLGNTVAKFVDLEKEVDVMIDELIEKRKILINQIDSLENEIYYELLTLKYIKGDKLDKIADDMGYSFRQITRIHGAALLDFEKKYGKTYLEK